MKNFLKSGWYALAIMLIHTGVMIAYFKILGLIYHGGTTLDDSSFLGSHIQISVIVGAVGAFFIYKSMIEQKNAVSKKSVG
ncbi:hypothetical protein PRVXH_001755 [Proteinivorax hydrogeniformans]|uniref:Uncharacterized protein n=1 Tax=Proteinivorax hydrogeniformans TaxID=1826727 RepID=A0AAU8HRS1_9FIRM